MSRVHARWLVLFLLLWALGSSSALAQVSHGGMPCPEHLLKASGLRAGGRMPYVEMPAFDVDSLLREDSLSGLSSRRFAHKFKVAIGMENSGTVNYLADGTKIWRVGITSQGAHSLNLLFTEYELPPQAKLFVYSPDRSTILGSFTAENRQKSGILPIAPIDGDSLVVEYMEPAGAVFPGRLKVGEVNHDYVGFRLLPSRMQAQECEVDMACDSRSVLPQKRSVCLIIVSGHYYCSGALVNNTAEDNTPYVLSASHCLFEDGANPPVKESLAETCVFFFNYESPFCYSDIKGTMEQSVAGASVAISNYKYDLLLYRLNEPVPLDYRPYYAGWNISEEMRPPFYMIHHPSGDLKKASVEEDMVSTGSFYTLHFKPESHWRVDLWDQGISEGGSSGSPLFDADNRIVGALSGGNTEISCSQRGDDNFYKLSKSWNAQKADGLRLSTWLDPLQKGIQTLDGKEASGSPCVRLSNIRTTDELRPQTENRQGYASGHNRLGYLRYAEKFTAKDKSMIYGIYFLPFRGAYSEESPVRVSIYSGTDEPEQLRHEQTLRITNKVYSAGSGIDEVLSNSWLKKENYLRLDSIISVEGNFFVVFDLPENYSSTTKFALHYTDDRKEGENTAFFFHNGKWQPFEKNEMVGKSASLVVDVVCQCSSQNSQEDVPQPRSSVAVGTDGTTFLFYRPSAGKKKGILYDLSGRVLDEWQTENDWSRIEAPRGVSLVRVIYDDYAETLKILK